MDDPQSTGSPLSGGFSTDALKEIFRDAVKFWEMGRIGYNLVLVTVTLAWVILTWPHFEPAMTWWSGLRLLVLAAIANVLYCAAYPVDFAFQHSPLRPEWREYRWILWFLGTLFAILLTCYWIADEIYPYVN